MKEAKDILFLLKQKRTEGMLEVRPAWFSRDWVSTIGFLVVFFALLLYVPIFSNESSDNLLSIATFAFAILLGFSLSRRYVRFSEVKNGLRFNDAKFIEIHQHSKVFSSKVQKDILHLIDGCLVSQIDYKLEDFSHSLPKLLTLRDYVFGQVKTKGFKQEQSYYYMLDACKALLESNKRIEHNIRDQMPRHEWIVLVVLSFIIWLTLLLLGGDSLINLLVIPLLATSIFYVLLILRQVDHLEWNEDEWIWGPLVQLFRSIDLEPYFPGDAIEAKRIPAYLYHQLPSYRVSFYSEPYPDMSEKEIIRVVNS